MVTPALQFRAVWYLLFLCPFEAYVWSGPILKASGLLAARVDLAFSGILFPASKILLMSLLSCEFLSHFLCGFAELCFFFFPFFLLLSSCHVSESSRMKCMYSKSATPVCSFYATIISRLAINTFAMMNEWTLTHSEEYTVRKRDMWFCSSSLKCICLLLFI